jgi:F0F1-type ATP synthase assembly protein I
MDYAFQLLFPILAGLFIGLWLHENFDASPLWAVGLAILGMVAGLAIMYKKLMLEAAQRKQEMDEEKKKP